MAVQGIKQLVDFSKQMTVLEGKRHEKKRKRNMLASQLPQDVVHCPSHNGKKATLCANRRKPAFSGTGWTVVAGKQKVLPVGPLDLDPEWLDMLHEAFP